jgi:hypothetical protein
VRDLPFELVTVSRGKLGAPLLYRIYDVADMEVGSSGIFLTSSGTVAICMPTLSLPHVLLRVERSSLSPIEGVLRDFHFVDDALIRCAWCLCFS